MIGYFCALVAWYAVHDPYGGPDGLKRFVDAVRSFERENPSVRVVIEKGPISILTDDCPVAVAASVMAYYDRENAGQCGSCFNGTAAMSAVVGSCGA